MNPCPERASISGMVVCLVLALMVTAGLTFDGGRVVDAYAEASSVAASTARLGGQELLGLRDGDVRFDVDRATDVMSRYLRARNTHGQLRVSDRRISVTVALSVNMQWLAMIGVRTRIVSVTRTAYLAQG